MFTGLVQELGTVVEARRGREVDRLRVRAPKTAQGLALGESVAVSGVCLSVVEMRAGTLTFEAIAETRRRTTIGRLKAGDQVNVERSLTLADRLGGHLVFGHVDGVGRVVRRADTAGQVALHIQVDRELRRYLVPKGPITVDGVSLTLGPTVTAQGFAIFLIPETLRKTTLGLLERGSPVNIEIDYVAKLLAQFVKQRYNNR
jgi:riboflavin synthase